MKTTLHADDRALSLEYTAPRDDAYDVVWNGETHEIEVVAVRGDSVTLLVSGRPVLAYVAHDDDRSFVSIAGRSYEFSRRPPQRGRARPAAGGFEPQVRSPMPGKILDVKVGEGETVADGQPLVLLEAMKMENALSADGPARVTAVHVGVGELVEVGQLLIELTPLAED